MAVIESKGDGYALYNGVKLPKLSDVEVECDTFDGELPYQFVFRNDFNDFYVFFSKKPFLVEYDLFVTYDIYTLYDWYWDSENLILNGSGFGVYEFNISDYEPVWSNHDIINVDDGDSVYFPASEDPIPLDGMNVIEWDGVNEAPYWDGNRDGYGMWDYCDGTIRLAPYAEASNAVAVIGGEVCTYFEIWGGIWEVYGSDEYERRGAFAERENGICACECFDVEGNVYRTSLIAYTPIEEEPEEPIGFIEYLVKPKYRRYPFRGFFGWKWAQKNLSGETEGKSHLLSSDGHTLTDVNGLYLIPKEDE